MPRRRRPRSDESGIVVDELGFGAQASTDLNSILSCACGLTFLSHSPSFHGSHDLRLAPRGEDPPVSATNHLQPLPVSRPGQTGVFTDVNGRIKVQARHADGLKEGYMIGRDELGQGHHRVCDLILLPSGCRHRPRARVAKLKLWLWRRPARYEGLECEPPWVRRRGVNVMLTRVKTRREDVE